MPSINTLGDQNVDVPDAAGVSNINSAPDSTSGILALTDGISFSTGSQWGIYLNGQSVISADTIVSFDYKKEYVISDYPVEEGGFQSFNKVEMPFDVRITYTAGGIESNRAALLSSIKSIVGDLNFYDIVTPEDVYLSANLKHYDYRRTAINGLGLLQVQVWAEEVRVTTGGTSYASSGSSTSSDTSGGDGTGSGDGASTGTGTGSSPANGTNNQSVTIGESTFTEGGNTVVIPSQEPAGTSPASPTDATQTNGGTVQATTPSTTQSQTSITTPPQ